MYMMQLGKLFFSLVSIAVFCLLLIKDVFFYQRGSQNSATCMCQSIAIVLLQNCERASVTGSVEYINKTTTGTSVSFRKIGGRADGRSHKKILVR